MEKVGKKELYALLVCPACRANLEQRKTSLYCRACDAEYPVIDGIAVMMRK